MDEKITVIIPVYKVEPFLRQCLDSVVNQTYRNLEIIIIDDGSPDNCGIICDEYANKDTRIQVIHKKNEGLCAARNDGIKRATGEWLTFVDSDDWCEVNYYSELMKSMGSQRPDIFFAGGRIAELPDGNKIGQNFSKAFSCNDKEDLEKLMIGVIAPPVSIGRTYGAPWDKLYRRKFVEKSGLLFDLSSKAWEDLWFNFQAFDKAHVVSGCTYIGYHYRVLSTSITGNFNSARPNINYDFVCKLQDYARKHGKSKSIIMAIHAKTLAVIKNTLDLYYFHPNNKLSEQEIEDGIQKVKSLPFYREAIMEGHNPFVTKKQQILKYLLRMRSIWLLRVAYKIEKKMGR